MRRCAFSQPLVSAFLAILRIFALSFFFASTALRRCDRSTSRQPPCRLAIRRSLSSTSRQCFSRSVSTLYGWTLGFGSFCWTAAYVPEWYVVCHGSLGASELSRPPLIPQPN